MKLLKTTRITLLGVILLLFNSSCGNNEKTTIQANNDYEQTKKNDGYSADAINNPDKFAWELFINISKPSNPSNPNGEIVWQTNWANAEDVFAENPMTPPNWDDIVGLPSDRKINKGQPLQQEVFNDMLEKMGISKEQFKQQHILGNCKDNMSEDLLVETRMNKATFDFIIENELYYAEGVEKMFETKTKIDLPIESQEIKAIWKAINEQDKSKYHYIEKDNKIYGLNALHIITKDLPNWTWATFEHIDNECLAEAEKNPLLKSIDTYGKNSDGTISKELKGDFIKNGMSEKWHNYILRGTQIDFTTSIGEKTILANTYTESGFETTSSCITCHARATVGPRLTRAQLPPNLKVKDIPDYFNTLDIFESRDPYIIGNVGSPDPTWFINYLPQGQEEIKYMQTDFLWSIPFRVKRRVKYKVEE